MMDWQTFYNEKFNFSEVIHFIFHFHEKAYSSSKLRISVIIVILIEYTLHPDRKK